MAKRLRIAIDGRPALWHRTGIGTVVYNVLRHIHRWCPDHDYFYYFDQDPGPRIFDYGPARVAFGGFLQEMIWANTFVPRQLKQDNVDVYITFMDKEIPFFRGNTKCISMIHDLIPLRFPEIVFRSCAHRTYYNLFIRTSARCCDLIFTNSEYSKSELVSVLGLDPNKIRKLVLGVEPRHVTDGEVMSTVLEKYSIRRPYILSIGSTEPRKNNVSVIQAFRRLETSFPDFQLVIGGRNWRDRGFDSAILDDRITLTGFIDDADMPILFGAADLFVFPSFHEGFGFPLLEAMAQGVPIITSAVTALPEVGGSAVLYCDPHSVEDLAEKMAEVLTNSSLAAELRRRGIVQARTFQWEIGCRQIVDSCLELV